jgi:hypothetical protein
MINALKNLAQMPLKLNIMAAMAQARPSKHAKGWQKPKRRKKYRDKCRARYVARMQEREERQRYIPKDSKLRRWGRDLNQKGAV